MLLVALVAACLVGSARCSLEETRPKEANVVTFDLSGSKTPELDFAKLLRDRFLPSYFKKYYVYMCETMVRSVPDLQPSLDFFRNGKFDGLVSDRPFSFLESLQKVVSKSLSCHLANDAIPRKRLTLRKDYFLVHDLAKDANFEPQITVKFVVKKADIDLAKRMNRDLAATKEEVVYYRGKVAHFFIKRDGAAEEHLWLAFYTIYSPVYSWIITTASCVVVIGILVAAALFVISYFTGKPIFKSPSVGEAKPDVEAQVKPEEEA